MEVLAQDPVKYRNRAIGCYNDGIDQKFNKHLGVIYQCLLDIVLRVHYLFECIALYY